VRLRPVSSGPDFGFGVGWVERVRLVADAPKTSGVITRGV
jgi:hypothetical protein